MNRHVASFALLCIGVAACGPGECPKMAATGANGPAPIAHDGGVEAAVAPAIDPARLKWKIEVVSPDGRRETFPLSASAARLPIALPCGVGPVQRNEKTPEYYAVRALECTDGRVTLSALSLCAVEDGRLRPAKASMTVRGNRGGDLYEAEVVTLLSLVCHL